MAKANKTAPVTETVTAPVTKETTSSQIRALAVEFPGNRSEIKKQMLIRHGKTVLYQHVRNVLVTPLKKTAQAPAKA